MKNTQHTKTIAKQVRAQQAARKRLIEAHFACKHDNPRNRRVVKCPMCRAEF